MKIAGCMVCSTVYLAELTKKLSFDPDNLLNPDVCQSTNLRSDYLSLIE